MINRRQFARALSALPFASPLVAAAGPVRNPAQIDWSAEFAAAQKAHPWLIGYKSIEQDAFDAPGIIEGKWPEGLTGTLYRNGPAKHEVNGYRYHHWFDGDGMLQAYRIGRGGVDYRAKLIETRKVKRERAAGRALYPGFASVPPNPAPVTSPDSVNVANISVLHHHDKLLALWEAGSPWEMDPESLDTKGIYAFTDHTRGVPFSAHPRVEADGTLWNFGYLSSAHTLVLWHIDKSGKLVKIGKIAADPITMIHDFVVTSRHIVMMVAPLHFAARPGSFLDAHEWHPEDPTRVLVIDKNDFDNHYWLELPSQWVFHYGNGWEDAAGIIRFDAARANDPLVMINTFRDIMRGKITPAGSSAHHQYRIDTQTKSISEMPILSNDVYSEFPCVDPRVSCRENRRITMLTSHAPAQHASLNEVSMFDYTTGQTDTFRYPDTQIPEEHLYVADPRQSPEQGGWILGTALDWQAQNMVLNVFDARGVADGPIASARFELVVPLGLHAKFVHA